MTSPFDFLFLTFLRRIFTLHWPPPTSTSPSVQTFFSVHSLPPPHPPCLALPGCLPGGASLNWTVGDDAFALEDKRFSLGFISVFPHQCLEGCTGSIIYSKTSAFQQDLTPFFNDIMFLYTFCGKEQHVTRWHHGWLLSNVKCPVL